MWGRRSSRFVALGGVCVGTLVTVALAADAEPGGSDTGGLAPSQVTADTVPPPDRPPDCDPVEMAVWTARPGPGPEVAVVRLRNDGVETCEAHLWGTPELHPLVEPDVWLDPGATADLVVGPSGRTCLRPEEIHEVGFLVGGVPVRVPTALVALCGWAFRALYPNEAPDGPCTDLAASARPGAIVFVNRSRSTCSVGRVTGVDGVGVSAMAPSPASVDLVAVGVLGPGDLAAAEAVEVGPAGACPPEPRTVEVRFDDGTVVPVVLRGCGVAVAVGPVRPWVGGLGGTSILEALPASWG